MRDLSGQHIRGYQVVELIGSGGFAAVYRARQPAVEREVAIKVILPRYANKPDFVRRFEYEAQIIARLEHMHIVPLYDYWREPDNAYLVMRWLRGGTLFDSVVKNGAWSPAEAARLLEQVAAALAVAHRSGVIHQDLTPANILLDEQQNAYLADFGIAKDLRDFTQSAAEERPLFGSPAYMAPEHITGTYISPQSDIYSLGIVLFFVLTGRPPFDAPDNTTLLRQQLQAPMPPLQSVRSDLPPELNTVILRAAAKNPGSRYPDALSFAAEFRRVVQILSGDGGADTHIKSLEEIEEAQKYSTIDLSAALAEPKNPYKGLRAFEESDAAHFFGRSNLIQQICKRIGELPPDGRLLAVVGPSGSGKSSLIQAGVIPALRRGGAPGSETWFYAHMTPGPYPFAELEMALLGVSFDAADVLANILHDKNQGLNTAVKQILPEDDSELVLFIDQFEEVFTQVEWENERRAFLEALYRAATAPGSRLRIVITLRADFYDRPLIYPRFGRLVRANTEVVLPLSPANLREAIVEPARREMLTVDETVVNAIVAEVTDEPGALPLLQYALTELFERRDDRSLTLAAYRETGGVAGALARRAEDVYKGLTLPQQQALRQLLLQLVTVGDNTADTRRRVPLSSVLSMSGIERAVMRSVLDELGRYRLLTFDRDPQTREPTVEVAHEALIGGWERLKDWVDESRELLRIQRQLAAAAAEWRAAHYDKSFLARGVRLAQYETLTDTDTVALTDQERAYLENSIQLRQRSLWQLRMFITGLLIITLAALVAAGFAWDREQRADNARATSEAERDRADTQARIARSRELAITAQSNSQHPDRALLLSLEALNTAPTFDALNSLLTLIQGKPYLHTILYAHESPVRAAAAAPDGRWVVTGDRSGQIVVWDAAAWQVQARVALPSGETVNALAVSPEGEYLAAGGADGMIFLWRADDLDSEPVTLAGHTDAVWGVAFDPQGNRLASASADTTVRLWDIATGEPVADWQRQHDDMAFAVAFSPGGDLLASGGADNAVRVWELDDGSETDEDDEVRDMVLAGHTNWVFSVAFSPDGHTLASGSADNTVRIWDTAADEPASALLEGHSDWVRRVVYNAEGMLASGSVDGTVRLWDTFSGQSDVLAAHTDAVWDIAFTSAGNRLLSVSADTHVVVWNTIPAPLRRAVLFGHREAVSSVAVSPDGTVIASAGGEPLGRGQDNTVRLWDANSGDLLAVLEGHTSVITAIDFAPGGDVLASASADGTVRLWSVPDGEALGPPLTDHNVLLLALAYSPDGKWFASGGSDGSLMLWDATTRQPASGVLFGHTGGILDLAFSPDGRRLASASEDGTIRFWNPATAGLTGRSLVGHEDVVTRLTFSPDGTLLASGSRDQTIRLWDVQSGEPVGQPLVGHERRVTALAFDPAGILLASGSQDATIRLWDLDARRTLGEPLAAHQDWVADLAFTPDGLLVSGSWDTQVIVWAASAERWREQACRIANRSMTADEWARFMLDVPYRETCPAQP